ncbi:MAG: hypothetical protein KF875_14410 [Trueperaceae bacterium]|nr:hypothetical protein [Trueperaceae bacterium]MCO5174028.1 hypothetical protein [Trueperaceae bacterium]
MRRSALATPVIVFSLLAALLGHARAQPLAADGGWGRPTKLPGNGAVATVGAAAGPDAVELVWADQVGVWMAASPMAGPWEPRLLAPAQSVRQVSAGTVAGELAVAWAQRDRATGRYHHFLWWRGSVTPLLDDPLEVRFDFVTLGGVPYALATLRSGGAAHLTLLPLDASGDELVLHTTELSVRGATYAQADDGGLWLAWLEGKTERTELGVDSEWNAFALLVDPAGAASSALPLGAADVTDQRQRALVTATPGGALAAWSDEESRLRAALVERRPAAKGAPVGAGTRPVEPASTTTGGPVALAVTRVSDARRVPASGRLLAAAWPYVYSVDGASFRRFDVTDVLGEAGAAAPVTNVLWSPVTVEGAEFVMATPTTPDAIAWLGRAEGGAVRLFTSDDRTPMRLTWRDRLARAMGWNPWYALEQAIGQALTAVLVGVLGALVSLPYLLVAAPLTARTRRGGARPRRTGAFVGAAPLVVAAAALAVAAGYGGRAPFATGATVAASVALGAAMAALATRKGDREPQATVLIAGVVTVVTGLALWAFVAYPHWAPLVGLA